MEPDWRRRAFSPLVHLVALLSQFTTERGTVEGFVQLVFVGGRAKTRKQGRRVVQLQYDCEVDLRYSYKREAKPIFKIIQLGFFASRRGGAVDTPRLAIADTDCRQVRPRSWSGKKI